MWAQKRYLACADQVNVFFRGGGAKQLLAEVIGFGNTDRNTVLIWYIRFLLLYFPFFYYNNLRQQSLEDEMENRCRILLQKLHVHDGMRFSHTDRQRGCGRVHQIRDTLTAIIRSVDVK